MFKYTSSFFTVGGTISIPENLSPTNLSMVQPNRLSSASPRPASLHHRHQQQPAGSIYISGIEEPGDIAYDLMTPMLSGIYLSIYLSINLLIYKSIYLLIY